MATKPVQGYEGYLINDKGEVFSNKREGKTKKLKEDISHLGYRRVTLSKDGHTKRFLVHRMVLEHFDRPPLSDEVCRHINGNPSDNRVENLTWGSNHENCEDARDHGTGSMKLSWFDVDRIRCFHAQGWYNSDISKEFGYSVGAIEHIIKGSTWQEKHRRKPFTRAFDYDMRDEWVDGEPVKLSRYRNKTHKINHDIADEIRRKKAEGSTTKELSEEYNLGVSLINNLLAYRTWKRK